MPFQFSLVLIVTGVVLQYFRRGKRTSRLLVTLGAGILLLFSNSFVGYHCVHSLETKYQPLDLDQLGEEQASASLQLFNQSKTRDTSSGQGPRHFIVVLSGGASDDPELRVTDRLAPDSALRVVEAVRIYWALTSLSSVAVESSQVIPKEERLIAGRPQILLSGGPTLNALPEAIPMQKLAESLGVQANVIHLEERSDDTASEAKDILPIVQHDSFILVTSAYHMPRAMALFQHLGMRPIPAPSNYLGRWTSKSVVLRILPNLGALNESALAWRERLGMYWEHLRGQL